MSLWHTLKKKGLFANKIGKCELYALVGVCHAVHLDSAFPKTLYYRSVLKGGSNQLNTVWLASIFHNSQFQGNSPFRINRIKRKREKLSLPFCLMLRILWDELGSAVIA